MLPRAHHTLRALSLAAVAGLTLAALSACQRYATTPTIEDSRGMSNNPNDPAPEQAITAALQYVATRWAPNAPEFRSELRPGQTFVDRGMVINLPWGTRQSFYDRIARKLGPDVRPATPESLDSGLPIYHVGRVWMRFEDAKVDVYRPMPELGPGPDGNPIYQMITVHLRGGFSPWRAEYARTWTPGTDQPPEVWMRPEVDRPNEHVLARASRPQRFAPLAPTEGSAPATTTNLDPIVDPSLLPGPLENTPAQVTTVPDVAPAEDHTP